MDRHEVDVLVVGGGMAGVMAAMAAAEKGCSVWIVEPSNVLGGQGTAGGVAGFCGDTQRVNHLFDELVNHLAAHDLIATANPLHDRRDYDLEWCAYILQRMAVARGVRLVLHARVLDAGFAAHQVQHVDVSTAADVIRVHPGFVIDASGRCLLPRLGGYETVHEGALKQLPMSLYFTLWDTGRKVTPILPEGCPTWPDDNSIPMTSLHFFDTGKVEVKMKVVGFDADDGLSLSEAEIFARRQMMGLIYYLQTHGYRGCLLDRHVLAGVSRQIGVREERRLVGEHVLTEYEVAHGWTFDDAIAVGTYHFDFHWPDRLERAGTGVFTMVEPYHIPLRSLLPREARNLLVAGRGISADQMAMSNLRVMATVSQIGLAAGLAAAQCIRQGRTPRDLDIRELQQQIEAVGQCLDLGHYGAYMRQTIVSDETIAEQVPPVDNLVLSRIRHGEFVATWQINGQTHSAVRHHAAWGRASQTKGSGVVSSHGVGDVLQLEDGWVRLQVQKGRLAVQGSTDSAATWPHELPLAENGVTTPVAAIVATPRGVAVAYQRHDTLRFWHGSFQHVQAGSGRQGPTGLQPTSQAAADKKA